MKGTLKSNDSNEQQQSHWHNLHTLLPSLSKCFFRCFFFFTFHTLKQMVTVIMQALTFVRHTYFSWKRMYHDSHEKKKSNKRIFKEIFKWMNKFKSERFNSSTETHNKKIPYIHSWNMASKNENFFNNFRDGWHSFRFFVSPDYCVTFVKHENSTLEFCMLRLEFQVFNLIWNEHFKLEFLIYF